jgi:hypothetical protein
VNPTPPTTDGSESHVPEREALEREADVVKGKLLRTIERLDDKRHHAMETALRARNDLVILAAVGGVLLGILLGEMRWRSRARERRPFGRFRHAWSRAFQRAG